MDTNSMQTHEVQHAPFTPSALIFGVTESSEDKNIVPGLMALDKFIESIGVTRETLVKWRRNGLLETCNIYGRLYVTTEEATRFKRRAMSGEFAKCIKRPKREEQLADVASENNDNAECASADLFKEAR
jgi:hypothetical protein